MIPRCFWDVTCITLILLNTCGGCDIAIDIAFFKTFCFLFLKGSHKKFNKCPDIPFCFHLKTKPLCQTLSNAFDISRKTSNPSSNDLYIS